jgi:hypothetical protein
MFKVVVLALVLPQMLMPSGMCFCQCISLVKSNPASIDVQSHTPLIIANHRPECQCDSCRAVPSTTTRDTYIITENENHRTPEPLEPLEHCPGCPAEFNALLMNATFPNVTVQSDFDLIVEVDQLTPQVLVLPVQADEPIHSPAHMPPFFISHCSLLI